MNGWVRLATESADVLRASIVGGKRGDPVTVLTGLSCTPVQPMDGAESGALLQRLRWDTPHQAKETFVAGHHGIRTGDVLAVGNKSYTVRDAAEWTPPRGVGTAVTHLVLEDVVP